MLTVYYIKMSSLWQLLQIPMLQVLVYRGECNGVLRAAGRHTECLTVNVCVTMLLKICTQVRNKLDYFLYLFTNKVYNNELFVCL